MRKAPPKKPALPRGPRPKMVPVMTGCPGCGVELEPGKGPHGLAWHVCKDGPSTLDGVEQDVLTQMRVAAREAKVSELIAMLAALRDHRAATGSSRVGVEADAVADWITRSDG